MTEANAVKLADSVKVADDISGELDFGSTATSSSNGKFWADFDNGDFFVGGGNKNSLTTILATTIVVGFVAWYMFKKRK